VFAAGLRSWLRDGPGALATPLAIAVAAVGVLLAGFFPTQPLFGYPPGTPEGMATDVSPASLAHVLGAILFIFGLIAAALSFAVRSWRGGSRAWALGSLAVAALVFVSFGASGGGPSGQLLFPDVSGLLQRVALIWGLSWVLALALLGINATNAADLAN
jgi:hypothetical protein